MFSPYFDIRNLSFVPESWRQIQGQIVLHQMLYVHITPFHIFYAIKFVKNWWIKARNRIDFSIYACIIESKAEYLGFSHSRKVEHFTRKILAVHTVRIPQKRKPILLSYNSILCFYQLKMCSWGSRPYGLSPWWKRKVVRIGSAYDYSPGAVGTSKLST